MGLNILSKQERMTHLIDRKQQVNLKHAFVVMTIPIASRRIRGNKICKVMTLNIIIIKSPNWDFSMLAAIRESTQIPVDIQTHKTHIGHNSHDICLIDPQQGREIGPWQAFPSPRKESLQLSSSYSAGLRCQPWNKRWEPPSVGAVTLA